MSDAVAPADGEVLVTAVAGNGCEGGVIVSLYRGLLVIYLSIMYPCAVCLSHNLGFMSVRCRNFLEGRTGTHTTPQGTPHSQRYNSRREVD